MEKTTIADLERSMDDGADLELLPNGEVVPRSREPDPPFPGYIVKVGDEHAAIYWNGNHWTRDASEAFVFTDWHLAKRCMSRLRDSSGTTVRTKPVGEFDPTATLDTPQLEKP